MGWTAAGHAVDCPPTGVGGVRARHGQNAAAGSADQQAPGDSGAVSTGALDRGARLRPIPECPGHERLVRVLYRWAIPKGHGAKVDRAGNHIGERRGCPSARTAAGRPRFHALRVEPSGDTDPRVAVSPPLEYADEKGRLGVVGDERLAVLVRVGLAAFDSLASVVKLGGIASVPEGH